MPIYEFLCTQCTASRDVIVDHKTKTGLELLCVHCGGVMKASEVHMFGVVSSPGAATKVNTHHQGTKSCGHKHACRCTIKMEKPNPFQKQINDVLGTEKQE